MSEISTTDWGFIRTLNAGKGPEHMVMSPDESFLYVSNTNDGTVSAISLADGQTTQTYAVGKNPHGIEISDDGRAVFASSKGSDLLVKIDVQSNTLSKVTLSPAPYHVMAIRGTSKLFVSSRKANKLWVIDQNSLKMIDEIKLKGTGHQMVLSAL